MATKYDAPPVSAIKLPERPSAPPLSAIRLPGQPINEEEEEERDPTVYLNEQVTPRGLGPIAPIEVRIPTTLPRLESTKETPSKKALDAYPAFTGDASLPLRTIGAAFSKAAENPLLGAGLRQLVRGGPLNPLGTPGADAREAQLENLLAHIDRRIENSPNQDFVRISELIGEFGPDLAMFGLAAGGAKNLAVRGLQRAAPELAGRPIVGKQMAKVAFKSMEDQLPRGGAELLYPRAVPKIQQAAEVLGEAIGGGGYAGLDEYIESGDITSATREAALIGVYTAGAATALRAGGKLLSRKGRELDLYDVEIGTTREGFKNTKKAVDDFWRGQAEKTTERIRKVLKVDEHVAAARAFSEQVGEVYGRLPRGPGGQRMVEFAELKPKRVFSKEQLKKARELRTRLREERGARRAFSRVTGDMVIPSNYTKGPRLEPGQSWETIEKLLLKYGKTPEAFFGQFGKTFAQFGQAWSRAESVSSIGRGLAESLTLRVRREMAGSLGLKETQKDGKFAMPVVHAYEKEGIEGVRQFMLNDPLGNPLGADRMVNAFRMVEHALGDYRDLALMGAEPVLTRQQLLNRRVKAYWPHVLNKLPDKELENKLIRGYIAEAAAEGRTITVEEATLKARKALGSGPSFGLMRSGTIDHTRIFSGSLQEKISRGNPFNDDPLQGLFEHLTNVSRRTAFGREFGFKGEIAEDMIALVEAETNARTASVARVMVDHAINRKFEDRALVQLADSVTSLQIGFKLPVSVLANLSQSSVTATQSGVLRTFAGNVRALKVAIKGEENDEVLKSVGLLESMMGVMGDVFFEGAPRTPFVSFARAVLKWSGFDAVEKFNRLSAGAAAYYDIQDTLVQAWRGNLRGATLDKARRRMGTYGLNLGQMIQRARAAGNVNGAFKPGEMETAIFRGAQVSQFIPSPTRKPLGWQGRTVGRVMTQFKTFALGYGRFMRDRVAAEAGRGNYQPLITWLGVSQPAGEFVAQTQAWVRRRERPDDGIARALDNASAIGGIGLVGSAFISSRYGSELEWALGPTYGQGGQMVADLLSGRVDSVLRDVLREPLVNLVVNMALVGIAGEEFIDEYLEAHKRRSYYRSKPREDVPSINEIRLPEK